MPTPLQFTDEEKDLLLTLAAPVAYGQRQEFLRTVAAELANCPSGPGAIYRVGAQVQRESLPPSASKQARA
jgi:hypothetical protein